MADVSGNDALDEGLSRLAATGPEYTQSLSTSDNSNKREAPRRSARPREPRRRATAGEREEPASVRNEHHEHPRTGAGSASPVKPGSG